jgi:hypothetical protein
MQACLASYAAKPTAAPPGATNRAVLPGALTNESCKQLVPTDATVRARARVAPRAGADLLLACSLWRVESCSHGPRAWPLMFILQWVAWRLVQPTHPRHDR